MIGLLRGLLGGIIAGSAMLGGLRAIGRGEKLPTEGVTQGLATFAHWVVHPSLSISLAGLKGGSKQACPPKAMHHLAKCPVCGKRGHEHESA